MSSLNKMILELEEVRELRETLEIKIENLEMEIDELEEEKYKAERNYRDVEKKEEKLVSDIQDYIKGAISNKICSDSNEIEKLIYSAALYVCDRGIHKNEFRNIYISKNKIYSIDGYRIFEGKCEGLTLDKDTFIRVDDLIEYGFDEKYIKDVEERSKESMALKAIKNQMNKEYKDEGAIVNITLEKFMKEYMYKSHVDRDKELYIFKLEDNLKIVFQKKYIDDAIKLFGDVSVNIIYSTPVSPLLIESQYRRSIVLPIRFLGVDNL